MLVRKRPTPGTPMAKSASFFSANSLTCLGVMICSARSFRSSGLTGGISRAWSSPFSRTVGGRPTLSSRSEAFRCTIWEIACLKLKLDCGAAAAFGSAIGINPEENLAKLDRLTIFDGDLSNGPRDLCLYLVHDLHRLDDADGLAGAHPVSDLDVGLRSWLRGLVKGPYHGRTDLLQMRCSGGRPSAGLAVLRLSRGSGCRQRRLHD